MSAPSPQRRLGRYMIVAAWLLAMVLLTALLQGWLERRAAPSPAVRAAASGRAAAVVLRQNRAGHYVTRGRINGEPVTFIVDTGATQVAIPEAVAQRIGLPRGAAHTVRTASGYARAYATRLERVTLGPLVLEDVSAQVNPAMPGREVLLGMSFLRDLDLRQRDGELVLRVPGAGGG